jgi:hypothetical protein
MNGAVDKEIQICLNEKIDMLEGYFSADVVSYFGPLISGIDTEKIVGHLQAIERFNDLESRGLLQKRGNSLLPIEKRYRLNLEYRNGK